MLAILLGLFGSFWFAVSMVLINRGVLSVDYFRGLLTNLGVNAVFLWIYVLIFTDKINLWEPANLLFVMIGVFVPGVARYFIFKGMERIGASISSCLTNSTPLFATLIAVLFLHERPSVTNFLGTFTIVSGIISLSWRGTAKTWHTRDLLFPIAAACLFAARDNLVRIGVVHIHAPILGASIAATTSLVTMTLMYLGLRRKKTACRIGPTRPEILRRRRLHELSFLRLRLHRAQHGTGIDHLAIDQRLIAVRIAVISVVSKRCRATDAKKNRRSVARDLGSVLNFLGKVLGWLAVRWVDFFEAQHS